MTMTFTKDDVNVLHDIFCGVTNLIPSHDGHGLKLPTYCLVEEVEQILGKACEDKKEMQMIFTPAP